MYLLIFVRLQAERRISFVKGSLAFMTGVHSKVATIMKETESGTRCGRRTMYVSCRFIASGSISVMRYNNNNALMASSMAGRWDLRTEVAGVLFLVIRRILWLVVNSMVAIRGFLIPELIASRMVRLLVLSGRAVPSLSMTMVRSRLVKTRRVAFLLAEGVGVVAEAALAAF